MNLKVKKEKTKMATRKAGIVAIKRVIEDELRRKINAENERRKELRPRIASDIAAWAARRSPLTNVSVNSLKFEVHHEFIKHDRLYCYGVFIREVCVRLGPNGRDDAYDGAIKHTLVLPDHLIQAVDKALELTIQDYTREAELLASRVLLRGEGGDLEKAIAEVVEAYIKEKVNNG